MRSPLTAVALAALLCLPTAAAHADESDRHPLVGEPPARVRLINPTDRATAGQPSLQATLEASLTGLPVYDRDQNEVGDVTAVLFAGDGTVDTLLIRMGESSEVAGQDVALPFELVTTTTGSDGKTMIVVATDGDEIAGAARFIGVDEVPPIPGH
jgi:hypothetical protein